MAKKDGELTPMMKQFFDLKAKHPDAVLLFRCGDFYETYCEDAVTAAKILGITLTHRNNGYNKGDEMAGFPHHALDTYLPKLVRALRPARRPQTHEETRQARHHGTGDAWCGPL